MTLGNLHVLVVLTYSLQTIEYHSSDADIKLKFARWKIDHKLPKDVFDTNK